MLFADVDPVFPLTFLVNSWIPGILDTIFQATFLTTLLLYWLCIYHGVRQVSAWLFTVKVGFHYPSSRAELTARELGCIF